MLELARATIEIRRALSHRSSRYWVYCLELNGGNFYVGETDNIWMRLADHIGGTPSSAKWVKRHGVRRVVEVVRNAEADTELLKTLSWMSMFGWERVRGASFCAVDLASPPPALHNFDRFAHTFDHVSQSEVQRIEATARELAALLTEPPPDESPSKKMCT